MNVDAPPLPADRSEIRPIEEAGACPARPTLRHSWFHAAAYEANRYVFCEHCRLIADIDHPERDAP